MRKFCPIVGRRDNGPLLDCGDRCMLYNEKGCMVQQALAAYIASHEPIKVKTELTQEGIVRAMEILKKPVDSILYKHPDLNIKHDYNEYGINWYTSDPNNIDP